MSRIMIDKIEYLILLISEFAVRNDMSESDAYKYLSLCGALALCDKHYNIMHTLSVEENIETLQNYCKRVVSENENIIRLNKLKSNIIYNQ